jgi:hypothetical protein
MPLDAADLAQFVDPDMPGYVQATLGGQPYPVLFSDKPAEGFGVSGSAPVATVPGASAPALGAELVIHGVSYAVADLNPGDDGMTRLILEKV